MIDFIGRVAVVTGAGRGLGREYALDLARRGASVVVNDLGCTMAGDGSDPAVADDVVAEIEKDGGTAVASYESIATPEGGEAVVRQALDTYGRLDAVVSNAGVFGSVNFEDITPKLWRRMLGTHLDGGFYVARPAYRVMKDAGYGRFVFIASSAGVFGQPQEAHYAAAKTGLVGLSNVIAIEGKEHGVLSNTVLPFGYSRMVQETIGGDPADLGPEVGAFIDAIRPELVAPMVTFLASETNTLTHQNFSACAGRFARVFAGIADGWRADGADPTAEDLAANLAAVTATDPYSVPDSIFDEVDKIWQAINPSS